MVCMHTHIHANAACIYTAYTQYCANTMHYAYTRKPTLCFHPVCTHLYVHTYKHVRLPVRCVLTLTRCLCVTGETLPLAQRKLYPKLLTQKGLWAQTTKAGVGCRGQLAQLAPIFSTILGVLCHCTSNGSSSTECGGRSHSNYNHRSSKSTCNLSSNSNGNGNIVVMQ